ncbi:MAG: 1-deoxy-D-xylulose-5-phosphate synthase [Phycisphaerae bacterium]|nr:1-deoxy-D-xylulose-5-phosphate synthase [Phycisphaerae bacterium]
MQYEILDKINSPADLKLLSVAQLNKLASELRDYITQSVSQTGGHLASNLGVVELTIAMHYVFDFSADRLLWDVGHQCYAHKILTGRRELFKKLRQKDGVSGFPNPAESPYDQFVVGHAGSSIPTALGLALASQKLGTKEKIIAFVGDASIVNGLSFEALNNLGLVKRQLLVVLNDNSMAIDSTQGAIAQFLAKVRLSHTYEDLRRRTDRILEYLPVFGKKMEDALKNFKRTVRMAITPNRLFESLNIPYFGPVDGHDTASLIQLFKAVSHLETPAVLHVYTKKGRGFSPADDNPTRFHSTGPFEINGEEFKKDEQKKTFTECFSDCIVELAKENEKITAITAAMSDGTGLAAFREQFKDRYYDVGIAESAAVDIAAGQAKLGLKPFVCIYSTFLQRSFDQIFQEVALQNLPVVFCIDRAGLVGADGPTHHGLMDIGFLRMMPNMVLISPANGVELKGALKFAAESNCPVAIRYPKDYVDDSLCPEIFSRPFEMGKSIVLRQGRNKLALVAYGSMAIEALKAAQALTSDNIDITVINARFAKPIDEKIVSLLAGGLCIITIEDHAAAGGFGSAVLEAAANAGLDTAKITVLGAGDKFIQADKRAEQLKQCGMSAQKIVEAVRKIVNAG